MSESVSAEDVAKNILSPLFAALEVDRQSRPEEFASTPPKMTSHEVYSLLSREIVAVAFEVDELRKSARQA